MKNKDLGDKIDELNKRLDYILKRLDSIESRIMMAPLRPEPVPVSEPRRDEWTTITYGAPWG